MNRPDRPTLIVLLVALAVLVPAAVLLALHLTSPFDGAIFDEGRPVWTSEGVIITALQQRPGGLRDDDLVVAVNGQPFEAWARDLFHPGRWHTELRKGVPATYVVERDGRRQDLTIEPGRYPLASVLARNWGIVLTVVGLQLVGAFVFIKRRAEPAAGALLFIGSAAVASTVHFMGSQVSDVVNGPGFWLHEWLAYAGFTLMIGALLHFTLVFPRPQPLVQRYPWVVPAIYATLYGSTLIWIIGNRLVTAETIAWIARWNRLGPVLTVVTFAASLVAIVTGYRAASDPVSRRQIRWVAFSLAVAITFSVGFSFVPTILLGHALVSWNVPVGLIVPIAIAIAIFRYRLFDIDVIISRTLIWGTLSLFVIGAYGLVVGLVGQLLDVRENLGLSLVATGLVALLFQPLRARVQRVVNRFVYGDRDDPYAVVSRLGQRLEVTLAPESVLPTIAETVAQALKLPYVAISLRQGDLLTAHAAYGAPGGDLLTLPLVYQSEPVGELALAARGPGDAFSTADRRLLEDLARQIGIAAHAVRLTEDLQQSRQRIVTAREEERRRLRRDLHDGVGPSLAGITLKLDAARNLLARDPTAVDALLAELKAQTQSAIGDVRRVVYDLRPPALDELGLVLALREHVARLAGSGLRITVEAPDDLPALPAAVEVAVYRIALEALTNVVRHAAARRCVVRLALRDAFVVEIVDDGRGLPADPRAGVGLTAMRERAAELGGALTVESSAGHGTRIEARLPLLKDAES
ncbi:MAG: histidine kinase [Thermomicrobiales bacterium]